jgi:hypothetical protein
MAADEPAHVRACSTPSHLHVPYQICYHFLKSTKKYRRGDARQNPPEIPGSYTPPAVHTARRHTVESAVAAGSDGVRLAQGWRVMHERTSMLE